jgi:hypothetical protein
LTGKISDRYASRRPLEAADHRRQAIRLLLLGQRRLLVPLEEKSWLVGGAITIFMGKSTI